MQKKNKLDKATGIKILKGAGIAGGAVILLYILEALTSIDFGSATPSVVAILSIFINAVKEFRKGE